MSKVKSRLTAAVTCTLAAGALAVAAPSTAQAASNGVNIAAFCSSNYGDAVAVLRGNTVMDWKCNVGWWIIYRWDVSLSGSDMTQACRNQGWRSARYANYNDPMSWYCV